MKTENLNLIKNSEGFRATPYLCPAKIATIGYGSTYYADGTKVKIDDNVILTEDEAVELLKDTLAIYEYCINKNVKVPLSQNQFDAIVSLVYNIGCGNFEKSTMLKRLNESNYTLAANEFIRWNQAGGKVLEGLTKRRILERQLFVTNAG